MPAQLLTLSVGMSVCVSEVPERGRPTGNLKSRTMTQILDLIGGALGTRSATGNEPSTPKTLDRLKDILNTDHRGHAGGRRP